VGARPIGVLTEVTTVVIIPGRKIISTSNYNINNNSEVTEATTITEVMETI